MTPVEQVQERIVNLSIALTNAHPTISSLLREIHTQLKADPEVVTLLSEEEIAVVVSGLKRQTATEIATSALKTTKGNKSLKSLSLADL